MDATRRGFLGGVAGLGVGGSAGCVDGLALDTPGGGEAAYTTFYTLETFTRRVAADRVPVENPIPVGEMGHRYEVGTGAQVDAARSAAFVYLDVEGFQRWALDAADNLREDHPEVTLVDALADVDLLDFEGRAEGGDGHDDEDGHGEADGEEDDADDDHDQADGGGDDGHDADAHGDFDPHYWLDPVRAATSVETIADGLATSDPENADAYREDAASYVADLEALDGDIRGALADRELETVVVAGHNSYQYLATRYDFEVHSPVGVSPNAEPSSAEIADTVALVDDLGIDVVLYDAFESPRLANTIVQESGASEALALSPVEGTKREWADAGWGYVDQMREMNLPALEEALQAT